MTSGPVFPCCITGTPTTRQKTTAMATAATAQTGIFRFHLFFSMCLLPINVSSFSLHCDSMLEILSFFNVWRNKLIAKNLTVLFIHCITTRCVQLSSFHIRDKPRKKSNKNPRTSPGVLALLEVNWNLLLRIRRQSTSRRTGCRWRPGWSARCRQYQKWRSGRCSPCPAGSCQRQRRSSCRRRQCWWYR